MKKETNLIMYYFILAFCFIAANSVNGQTNLGWSGDLNYEGAKTYGARFRVYDDVAFNGANRNTIWIGSTSNTRFDLGAGLEGVLRMSILTNGKIGVGTTDPTRLFDVNGALRVRSGGINGDPLIDLDHSNSTGWSRINSEGKLALAANDKLTGNSSLPHLFIDSDGSIFVTGGANLPSVSSQSRSKYSLFIQKGLLSEDYGLGPQSTWADYVFSEDYQLMPLKALSSYIQKYKHLPNMPTENEIAKNGYSLHDINVKLTEKVEELTLYTIKQQQELDSLKKDYEALLKLIKPILQKKP